MKLTASVVAVQLVLISSGAPAQETKKDKNQAVSFAKDVFPILKISCLECHNASKKKGKLDLSSYDALKRGGESGPGFVAGNPEKSLLVSSITGKEPEMPKKKGPLNREQVDLIAKWIKEGAKNIGEEQGNPGNNLAKDGTGKKGNDSTGAKGDLSKARTAGVENSQGVRDDGKNGGDEEGVKGKRNKRIRGGEDDDDDEDGVRAKNAKRSSRGDDGEDEVSRGRKGQRRSGDDD